MYLQTTLIGVSSSFTFRSLYAHFPLLIVHHPSLCPHTDNPADEQLSAEEEEEEAEQGPFARATPIMLKRRLASVMPMSMAGYGMEGGPEKRARIDTMVLPCTCEHRGE